MIRKIMNGKAEFRRHIFFRVELSLECKQYVSLRCRRSAAGEKKYGKVFLFFFFFFRQPQTAAPATQASQYVCEMKSN